jgi:hypothetical protein
MQMTYVDQVRLPAYSRDDAGATSHTELHSPISRVLRIINIETHANVYVLTAERVAAECVFASPSYAKHRAGRFHAHKNSAGARTERAIASECARNRGSCEVELERAASAGATVGLHRRGGSGGGHVLQTQRRRRCCCG